MGPYFLWVFTYLSCCSQTLLWISGNNPVFEHGCETGCLTLGGCLPRRYMRCDYRVWDWLPLDGRAVPMEFAPVGWFFVFCSVCGNRGIWIICGSSFLSFFLQDFRMFEMSSGTHPAKLLFHWLSFSPLLYYLHWNFGWETFLLAGPPLCIL